MIYLDNAATTPLDGNVLEAMLPYMQTVYGNSQSQHAAGRNAARALLAARDDVAEVFGCSGSEVLFLSGGTEAGNFAVKGVCEAYGKGHLIISAIEHPAVYDSALAMQKRGFDVTFIQPDEFGVISPDKVEEAVRADTIFCAVMAANNETGVIQDVEKISEICTRNDIFFYSDCVQAVGAVPFPKSSSFAVSAHKFYGPKGAAAMYIKKGSKISSLISGGRQEMGLRGGTVNVASAVGLAAALKIAAAGSENAEISAVRDRFLNRVLAEIPGAELNGDRLRRVPSNANISIKGCNGDNMVFALDLKGICVSTGSACSAGAVTPSRAISVMVGEERAKSALRFSFGKYNTAEEADFAVEALKQTVAQIRGSNL